MKAGGGTAPGGLQDTPSQQCSPNGNPSQGAATCFLVQPTATPSGAAPTATPQPTQAVTLLANPQYNAQNGGAGATTNTGYNFIFTVPPTGKTVLLKVLDPLDECQYGGGPSATPLPTGDTYNATGAQQNVIGADGSTVSQTLIDQCWPGSYWTGLVPTSLQFTIYKPATRIGDNNAPEAISNPDGMTLSVNPVVAGAEWEYTPDSTGSTSVHGTHRFEWFTLASIINSSSRTEYVRVQVQSIPNTIMSGTYMNSIGDGGNNFSLGMCSTTNDTTNNPSLIGNITKDQEWMAAYVNSGNIDTGCTDPNTDPAYVIGSGPGSGTNCPDSSVTCYHVNAREAMCIETLGSVTPSSGQTAHYNAIIPLAEIGANYKNSDVIIRLFDPGDVSLGSTDSNSIGVWGPEVDPATVNHNFTESYHLDLYHRRRYRLQRDRSTASQLVGRSAGILLHDRGLQRKCLSHRRLTGLPTAHRRGHPDAGPGSRGKQPRHL